MKHLNHAKPYSDAAFLYAKEKNQIDLWRAFLKEMARIFNDSEIKALIKNPKLNKNALIEVLTTSFEPSNEATRNFLKILSENQRLSILPEIYELFEKDAEADANVVEVELTFAQEPNKVELEQLYPALKKKFGAHIKEVIKIDANILSGVIIESGDYVMDGSLRGQLESLKLELMRP